MSDAQGPAPAPEAETPPAPMAKPGGELSRRVISALVLGAGAIATAWLGGVLFLAFWTAAALAVWWEWTGVTRAEPRAVASGIGAVVVVAMAVALQMDVAAVALLCAVIGAGVAMAGVQTRRAWAGTGVLYAAAILIPAVMLRSDPALGFVALVWLFAVVWSEDTAAYFTGRYFGGPRLAPSISPSKTWSGAAGGTIAGLAAGSAVVLLAGIEWKFAHLLTAFAAVVAAQTGDLLESAVKRRFAVKDASTLVPGHGGLMDRLDGFLAAALVALVIGVAAGGAQSPAAGLMLW